MRMLTAGIILLLMLTILYTPGTVSQGGTGKVVVIIAPGFDTRFDLNYTRTLQGLFNKSFTATIVDNAPYDPVYHLLLLINTSWDLGKAISQGNNEVMLSNGSVIESYKTIDHNNTMKLWGQLDTLFISLPVIDPTQHPRTLNPYYNEEGYVIPPTIFKIPWNSTAYWNLLNTTLSISKTEAGYKLVAKNYFSILISNASMASSIIKINITSEGLGVKPGIYYLNFRILNVTSDYAIVFTPGTRESHRWMSEFYGEEYKKPIITGIPVDMIDKMGVDDIKWLMGQINSFYTDLLSTAYKYKGATLQMVYYPVYLQALESIIKYNLTDEEKTALLDGTMKTLSAIIENTRVNIGENITVIIYSPFRLSEEYEKVDITGAQEIVPGLYKITGNLQEVLSQVTSAVIFDFNGEKYMVVKDPSIGPYDNGLLLVYYPGIDPAKYPENMTLTPISVASYIASLVNGYGYGLNILSNELSRKQYEINNLKTELNSKNSQIEQLNQKIKELELKVGNLTAENTNLTLKLRDYEQKLDEAKQLKDEAYEYLLAGTSSIIIIVILLHLLFRSAIAKKPAKGRK